MQREEEVGKVEGRRKERKESKERWWGKKRKGDADNEKLSERQGEKTPHSCLCHLMACAHEPNVIYQ